MPKKNDLLRALSDTLSKEQRKQLAAILIAEAEGEDDRPSNVQAKTVAIEERLKRGSKQGRQGELDDVQIEWLCRKLPESKFAEWMTKNPKQPPRQYYVERAKERRLRPENRNNRYGKPIKFADGTPAQKELFEPSCPLGSDIAYASVAIVLKKFTDNETGEKLARHVLLVDTVFTENETDENSEVMYDPFLASDRTAENKSFEAVRKDYESLTSPTPKGRKNSPLGRVADYLEDAFSLKSTKDMGFAAVARLPKRMGFALACALETKTSSVAKDTLLGDYEVVCRSLQNAEIYNPKDKKETKSLWAERIIPSLAIDRKVNNGTFTTNAQFKDKVRLVIEAYEAYRCLLADAIGADEPNHGFNLEKELTKSASDFYQKNKDKFDDEDNHPCLHLHEVEYILQMALRVGVAFYHRTLLHLSLCLRTSELELLLASGDFATDNCNLSKWKSRTPYMEKGGGILYNRKPISGEKILINKTLSDGKAGHEKLSNPGTSLVARTILKYLACNLPPHEQHLIEKFFAVDSPARRGIRSTDASHQRCIRTTGATNLRLGEKTEIARPVTSLEVARRLGHVNTIQTERRYGRIPPGDFEAATMTCDSYWSLQPIEIDGVIIAGKEYGWDLWLLRHFIETHIAIGDYDDKVLPLLKAELPKPVEPPKPFRAGKDRRE